MNEYAFDTASLMCMRVTASNEETARRIVNNFQGFDINIRVSDDHIPGPEAPDGSTVELTEVSTRAIVRLYQVTAPDGSDITPALPDPRETPHLISDEQAAEVREALTAYDQATRGDSSGELDAAAHLAGLIRALFT